MPNWVIHKKNEDPDIVSYDGEIWDMADLRGLREDKYDTFIAAETVASLLRRFHDMDVNKAKQHEKSNTI